MKTKGKIQDIYPLTPMQEGMLFHALYEKRSSAYFVQTSYRLHGELNLSYVKKSLNELLKRYDILRTVFIYEGRERPLQVVLKEREIDFYFEDIRKIVGNDTQKIDAYVEQSRKKDRQRSFDLSKDVLIRVSILQVGDSEYEFTWSHHHILMDGWCTGILVLEFLEIYNSYLEDRPYHLPKAKQFKTYIEWLEKQDKDEGKNYWNKYLENYEEPAAIPFKLFNTSDAGYEVEQNSLILDPEKTYALKELAARNQVTLNIFIQVVWGIILGKYNDRYDMVYGGVVSGRPSQLEGIESVIGIFINTIPVRIRWEAKTKFNELLQRTQEEAINCEPYHHCPLVEIQSESALKRNLFDHIIVFENYPVAEQLGEYNIDNSQRKKLELSNVESFVQTNYDFNLIIIPGEQLTIKFDYNANIYEGGLIRKIANHFDRVLIQVLDDPQQKVEELTHLSGEEKRQLLYDFNNTKVEYPKNKTINKLFEEQVEITPDNIAVIGVTHQLHERESSEGTGGLAPLSALMSITYNELNEKSGQLAHRLRKKGVKPDTIVGIMVERSVEMIIGILGILKSRGGYLPIDPEYPEERINYMLTDSSAKVLVTTSSLTKEVKKLRSLEVKREFQTIFIDSYEFSNSSSSHFLNFSSSRPTDIAYIIYTSGSTGRPKGVIVEHRSVFNRLNWMQKAYPLHPQDIILQKTPVTFDVSVWELFWWCFQGASICLLGHGEEKDPGAIIEAIERNKVTTIHFVPSMLNAFLEYLDNLGNMNGLSTMKYVFASGEALSIHHVEVFNRIINKRNETKLINLYGPTEATVDVSFFNCPVKEKIEKIPIGKPIDNIRLYVVNKGMSLQPIGIPGELCITGVGLARGYSNRPELTAEKFKRAVISHSSLAVSSHSKFSTNDQCPMTNDSSYKLYKTGDLSRWLPDGNIEFLGRIDNQVKIRGFRIELGEIEKQLLRHEEIKDALVLPRKNENGEVYLCAYIVAQQEFLAVELREYLAKELPDYMIPSYFVQVEKIPLTLNGKVDKKILESYTVARDPSIEYAAPENDTEELIAAAWKEVLIIDDVGVNDNFFDVGGHSLNIIRLNSRLKNIFQKDIPIVDMFRYPTIRSLARYLDNEKTGDISNEKIDRSISIMEKTTKLFLGN